MNIRPLCSAAAKPLVALLLAAGLLSGCAGIADAVGHDTQSLNTMAAGSYQKVLQDARSQNAIDTTSATARRVQAVFQRMKPHATAANRTGVPFDWQMTVIRSKELNAWAMPGGKMAVYTGLVEQLKLSDDEIAAVVGHEMVHALHEHAKQAVGQQVLTGLALDIGGRILTNNTNISADTVSLSQSLLSEYGIGKPFNRHQERDADRGGLVLMAQAGYDPRAAITVWEKMTAAGSAGAGMPSILSTHPNHADRISDIRKQLPEVMPIYEQSRRKR
ncbi:Zn-dependent protease with chaperone function [Neisseria sp. HSC-16F19]|nr:M48 family metallopeptidase [Neisseria sp. HSC-16F19]MCP2040428.1 Zn-dependent protease with chaperone function [Neisseria sp. HSC-16F19]